jgi:hypothetical protein
MSNLSTPLRKKIVPARGAAKKAAASFVQQLDSPEPKDGHPNSPFGDDSPTKTKVTKTYARKGRVSGPPGVDHVARLSKFENLSPTSQSSTKKRSRKRPSTPSEISDTDTSSDTDLPTQPLFASTASPIAQVRPRRHSLGTSLPLARRNHVLLSNPSTPSSSLRDRKPIAEKWELSKLEKFVWVLVDRNTQVVADQEESSDLVEARWWPGQVEYFRCPPLDDLSHPCFSSTDFQSQYIQQTLMRVSFRRCHP